MESRIIIKKQVISFLLITTAISAGIFFLMFNRQKENISLIFLMMWTPGISAIITSIFFKEKLSHYGWQPGKLKYLLLAPIMPVIVAFIGYGIPWLSGFAEFTTAEAVNYKWAKMLGFDLPAPLAVALLSKIIFASLIALIFTTGEEIGWSGFLIPKLLKISSIPAAGIFSGIYWSIWHYPALAGGFYGSGAPLWISIPGFTLVITGASITKTIIVAGSGSLWTGVLLHISHNVVLMGIFYELTVKKEYTSYIVSESGIFLGFVYLATAFTFWKIQKKKNLILSKQAFKPRSCG